MKKYKLGLDIGTNSVGWALVDENNQIVKKNGYALWGVRMFEEASDASQRRNFRTNRTRLDRRKYRVELLRDIFKDEIINIDPTFFERLDDSFYKIEDKRNANFHNLFVDGYTDKDFFSEYPTIYHLRQYLIKEEKKVDIRFLYLAIHNMVKFRGNFLTSGDSFSISDTKRIEEIFDNFKQVMIELSHEFEDDQEYFDCEGFEKDFLEDFTEVMLKKLNKIDKKTELKKVFNVEKKTLINEFLIPLLTGSNLDMSKLSIVKDMNYEKCKIDIENPELESQIEEVRSIVPELQILFDFIPSIKEIVDYYFLVKLLNNSRTLSEAMVNIYGNHEADLRRLKKFVKKYIPMKYNECFRMNEEKINNYPAYIGYTNVSGETQRFGHCKRNDFYGYLKKSIFEPLKEVEEAKDDIEYFTLKIENNDLLLRQNSDQNGSIPMQLNLLELKMMLDNQKNHYEFISQTDEDGISNYDKIIEIFKYKVPYYVGHLNKSSNNSWVVRKNEKIYPWNFSKVVDLDETSKLFIERMQRKCTYLRGESDYCCPKNSLVFSEYSVLSYLNKLSLNGSLISKDLKQDLIKNVFLKNKKPTKKMIYDYIHSNYGKDSIGTLNKNEIPEVNCDLSSHIKFREIFKDEYEEKQEIIEQIIKDICIFEDKKILEKRLKNIYKLDSDIIKKIKDLNYKKYSNISRKLLTGIKITNPDTGEYYGSVIEIMRETNSNLQQILYDERYRLIDIIDEYNKTNNPIGEELKIEDFIEENIYVSPIMKRPLIQAYKIIDEVEKIINQPIDYYCIECTRTNKAEKKPTNSRYKNLKELYKSCDKIASEFDVDLKKLEGLLDENQDKLRSDLIYLYFTQLGKCMYSLEDIDFSTLFKNNVYDIDHIYPQSIIKDDSISNRVLELKKKNNEKSDRFIFEIDGFLDAKAYSFYEKLFNLKLITKEKYLRLSKKELKKEELEGFVNRQIVATNQAVKGLIEVLKQYKNINPSHIIYSKGENISDFRREYDLPKSRTANNFHHAHDAYLNAVVGKALNDYYIANHFNASSDYLRMKADGKSINPITILNKDRYHNGKIIWKKDEELAKIKRNLYNRYDVNETIRTYNSNAMYEKTGILPANKSKKVVSMKMNSPLCNVNKYGGIISNSYSKYIIIKTTIKNKTEYILEAIPKRYEDKIEEYLKMEGYDNFEVINDNIKTNCVVEHNKLKYVITGKSDDRYCIKNLNDRFFHKNKIETIKKIDKYMENLKKSIEMNIDSETIIISPAKNDLCKSIILTKEELIELFLDIKSKYSKDIYAFSNIGNILLYMDISFDKLSIVDLTKIDNELLKLLKTNERKTADLSNIGLKKTAGSLRINKKLMLGMKFVYESITGYYKKVLFEVPDAI